MAFSKKERSLLLEAKFVGPKVIERLEDIGIDSFKKLSNSSVNEIVTLVSAMIGSSCWKNSYQSKEAIQNAIDTALLNL